MGDMVAGESAEQASAREAKISPTVPEPKQQLSRQLFVRSLPLTTTQEILTELFSQSYPLRHAVLVCDSKTKASKGYGFVTFADAEDAQRALEEFNGSMIEGHKIKVEFAEHRHRAGDDTANSNKIQRSSNSVAQTSHKDGSKGGHRRPDLASKLIVRNLPWSIKEPEQLAVLFRSYGKVKHAVVPKRKPGLLAGFGFVMMRGHKNAEKAIEGVNGKEVDGRTIAVDWAVEKQLWEELHQKNQSVEDDANGADEEMVDDVQGSSVENGDSDAEEGEQERSDKLSDALASDEPGEEVDVTEEEEDASQTQHPSSESTTVFLRNVPFTTTDDSLHEHFTQFGPVRYARIVLDPITERPKGSAFVCFYRPSDAETCLREAPRHQEINPSAANSRKKPDPAMSLVKHSVLQNEMADPTGRYTLEGRVLQISRAVEKAEAARLTEVGTAFRDRRDQDKRRLYLLSEGTVTPGTTLYKSLPESDIKAREASNKQRKTLIQSNPTLHLSLTRLSVRNIPRTVTSKALKALARQAVVEFAKDVKAGKRQPLSKEELDRGGEEMKEAEKARKAKGQGIVKQAKIVFEGREGGKVSEASGAGRSRGYGFIEYTSHRWALMGLRWLNGHTVDYQSNDEEGTRGKSGKPKKKRLIVEFAIENVQVMMRRKEREARMRDKSKAVTDKGGDTNQGRSQSKSKAQKGTKRKREVDNGSGTASAGDTTVKVDSKAVKGGQTRTDTQALAKRQRIIAKKRMQRRSRKQAD
ncbi:MAG: RNA recognition motif-containing protein [Peltula sp. TS41687]|nr:MAG: RNA recognition motif-containing protein [Peltula sp. TS41687]